MLDCGMQGSSPVYSSPDLVSTEKAGAALVTKHCKCHVYHQPFKKLLAETFRI